MNVQEELDNQFSRIQKQSIDDFEHESQIRREEQARLLTEQEPLQRQELERISRILDVPADRLSRSAPGEDAKLKGRIAEVERELRSRTHPQSAAAATLLQSGLSRPGSQSVPVLATNIMASSQAEIAAIEGQHGNPWVQPWNPGHITIKQELQDNEYGLCGWARPHVNDPIVADIWFAFLSDRFANWQFIVVADFHGFWVLNAQRGFLLCRDSRVTLDASVNVYQYFWFGDQITNLINEDSDTGFRYSYYDQSQLFSYSAFLRADQAYWVFVRLRIKLQATAYGGYAQINFADGSNFINPLILIAWPA